MPHRLLRTRFVFLAVLAMAVTGCGGGAPTGDVDKIDVVQSQRRCSRSVPKSSRSGPRATSRR